jgi:hypothetical protein
MVEGKIEGGLDDLFFLSPVPRAAGEPIGHGRHETKHAVTSFVVAPISIIPRRPAGRAICQDGRAFKTACL